MNVFVPNISLFIPRVFASITEERIAKVFDDNSIGKVSKVDFVSKLDSVYKPYHSVYIHFETWYSNQTALNFYNRVVDPNIQARIVYDDPWYWIVLKNNGKKNELAGVGASSRAVCLDTIGSDSGSGSGSGSAAGPDYDYDYESDKANGRLDLVSSDYVLILEETNKKLSEDLKKYENFGFQQSEIIVMLNSQIEKLTDQLHTTQYCFMELCEKYDVDVEEDDDDEEDDHDVVDVNELVSNYIQRCDDASAPLTLDDLDTTRRLREEAEARARALLEVDVDL
jgi:hypothetical protein